MNTKKEEVVEKKPLKNYIILGIIIVLTIILVFYLRSWYRTYLDYQLTIPVIRGELSEITEKELPHYLLEGEEEFLYICTSDNLDCRNFEDKFVKLIKKEELKEHIVYLNVTSLDKNTFITDFNKKYGSDITITNYPVIVHLENSKMVDKIEQTKKSLNINKVNEFIKKYIDEE